MSVTPSRKPSSGQRRRSVGTSSSGGGGSGGGGAGRYAHTDTSSTNTYPGRARAAEGGPAARTYPSTPRRQIKHAVCGDNHGIRPPTPEQYLTPLQQKEVCIRHLRARLRENVERLQHRDSEIDELRTQLYRMQEDWIEEECHRVEAQLALKEARKEIQHLQGVVETVRSNLGVRDQEPQDLKPYPGLKEPRAGGRSRSCGCSPAGTLSRSGTSGRLSSEALQLERETGRGSRPVPGQTHLLLEAALLSEQPPARGPARGPPAMTRSSTYERMCSGGAVLPVSHSCHSLSSGCRCSGHTYLPHHHLFLHLPQEEAVTPPPPPPAASDPIPTPAVAAEKKPRVRSQACSPTMTWLGEDGAENELSVISLATSEVASSEPLPSPLPAALPPYVAEPRAPDRPTDASADPQTRQPLPAASPPVRRQAAALEEQEGEEEEREEGEPQGANQESFAPQLCHWSRYFLVDLLALAVPVVPTMAWLCRGRAPDVMPAYHIGSLLRGCCAVALHSLRRRGAGRAARADGTTSD